MPFDPFVLIAPLPGETLLSTAGKLVLAAVLGAIIGIEREMKNRAAGLRTHMLTALAGAAFTLIAWGMYDQMRGDGSSEADPIRVVEAVTAGIAFLGAGAIIQSRDRVRGLTTGAGMWLAGAIGLAVGLGFWQIALVATVLAIIVLGLLQAITHRHDGNAIPADEDPPKRR